MKEQIKIGWIGTGVMGKHMAGHLLHHGYQLHLHTRTPSKAQTLLKAGAQWQASPKSLAESCSLIFTMVGDPSDVRELYLGEGGLLSGVAAGSTLVDMTTSDPGLAMEITEQAGRQNVDCLDAPVSGGDQGAAKATLSIMVGGEQEVFRRILPVLQCLGSNIVWHGAAGSGQNTKMVNQMCIAGTMVAVAEALRYGQATGLDLEKVLTSISSGAAGSWALSHLAPRMLVSDWQPGFFVKHFVKDMQIAINMCRMHQLEVPGLELALKTYESMMSKGLGDCGTQAIFRDTN